MVELSTGTHRVADELRRHSLADGEGGHYGTNLDRNRYGSDNNYLFTGACVRCVWCVRCVCGVLCVVCGLVVLGGGGASVCGVPWGCRVEREGLLMPR